MAPWDHNQTTSPSWLVDKLERHNDEAIVHTAVLPVVVQRGVEGGGAKSMQVAVLLFPRRIIALHRQQRRSLVIDRRWSPHTQRGTPQVVASSFTARSQQQQQQQQQQQAAAAAAGYVSLT
jgi:hypothetical protein